ncbi:Elongation factor 1-beta 1 [Capsicum baccatum]|uniref:Elongation factor 1-beta 1 n=1 Tax=Capsicum baccatum TaxID=33114 RepID=A0A2G2X5J4_CAPBA|nr:Elongation factor 1-beta 1 [Capsicum baccatum]
MHKVLSQKDLSIQQIQKIQGEEVFWDMGSRGIPITRSYYDLPYQHKPCFLYLNNFSEDQKISARRLYQLWAAEGIISLEVITFSNLHTEFGLKFVNDHLSGKTYISGDQLTKDDIKVYGEILKQPSSDSYPNASKWYQVVFAKLASSFPGKAVGVRFGSQTAPTIAEPAQKTAKPSDDDIDLFREKTKDEKMAAEAREAVKVSTKKKVSEKSPVLMDFKTWDDKTNMKKLEDVVRSIEVEGLL